MLEKYVPGWLTKVSDSGVPSLDGPEPRQVTRRDKYLSAVRRDWVEPKIQQVNPNVAKYRSPLEIAQGKIKPAETLFDPSRLPWATRVQMYWRSLPPDVRRGLIGAVGGAGLGLLGQSMNSPEDRSYFGGMLGGAALGGLGMYALPHVVSLLGGLTGGRSSGGGLEG
ncbi:MAG: hypothetical protein KatS3mg109_0062 [Pirellulaceae bacterium]|nr:MAG: hypothetical protein KatS3mg109_0062 [Pirellulaceae bacterium]